MSNTKGIAIRLDQEIYKKIEKHELPRNDLIQKAVMNFLEDDSITNKSDLEENIPDEIYEEVYNTLYNAEVAPLKQKVEHQQEMITLLKEQLNESRSDKKFLQNEILHVQSEQTKSKMPLRTRIKRRLSKSNSQKSEP